MRLGEGLEACAVNVVGRTDCGECGNTVGPRRDQGYVSYGIRQTNEQLSSACHVLQVREKSESYFTDQYRGSEPEPESAVDILFLGREFHLSQPCTLWMQIKWQNLSRLKGVG